MKNYLFLATAIIICSCSGDLKKENAELKAQLEQVQKLAEEQAALAEEAVAAASQQVQMAEQAALELSSCSSPKEHTELKTQLKKAQSELTKQLELVDEQRKLAEEAQLEAEKEAEIAKRQTHIANDQKLKAEKQAALVNQLKTKAASAEEEAAYIQKELEEAKKALEACK